MASAYLFLIFLWTREILANHSTTLKLTNGPKDKLLPVSFPSKEDTLAYVDALKHSNFSQWRSLEQVAKAAGGGSCSGAANTSVLTALYLLGLFNLCAASPASCCIPSLTDNRRRKRSSEHGKNRDVPLHPLLNVLTQNLSSLSLDQLSGLPQVSSPHGGKVPVHISVVEEVRKLWDANPRLLSNHPCNTATEAVRSSFISLSGVASGIILAYSIAQLNQCYPDMETEEDDSNKILLFPIPNDSETPAQYKVRSLPPEMPVKGEDDPDDGCERTAVRMEDGGCVPLLSSSVCPYMQWVLLNRETRKGECYPRLCSDSKVFVESDQMCHDVSEPEFCPENQRLFLTAWGEAVCDCLDGMFYGPDKKCHRIYDRAYCSRGTVLQFHKPSKTLTCQEDPCNELNDELKPDELPFAKSEDDQCYQFGSTEPCEDSEQFGFDIESLEPSCVSLEAAGLLRAQRSYQFSHMSFPSFPDHNFPHYEVSYVILNGSTWELMMRTVGRQKRDSGADRNVDGVPFIDTRDFPLKMDEVFSNFKGLESVGKRNRKERKETEKPQNISWIKRRELEEKSRSLLPVWSILGINIRKNQIRKGRKRMKKNTSSSLKPTRSKRENQFKRSTEESRIGESFFEKPDSNGVPHYRNERNKNELDSNSKEISNEREDSRSKARNDGEREKNEILIKIMTGKSDTCKWQISFYSQMPNISLVNATSINILGHPNFSTFKIKKIPKNNTIEIEEVLKTGKEENESFSRFGNASGNFYSGDQNKSGTETGIFIRGKSSNQKETDSVNTLSIKDDDGGELRGGKESERGRSSKESKPESELEYEEKDEKEEDEEEEFSLVKERLKEVEASSGQEDRDLHMEKGIQKVSQNQKQSLNNQKETRKSGAKKTKNKFVKGKRRKKRRRKRIRGYKNRHRKRKNKNKNKTEEESGKRNPENETPKSNVFRNQSLPDYLRNRGRRQAGIKRGSKLRPGIINAPLLNQCRPGAKRDYNGHCRPKVIPSVKVPPPKKHTKLRSPSPPRMKCKEGKRLDSRGVCRATFSGLG